MKQNKLNILLLDDDVTYAMVLANAMLKRGHTCIQSHTIEQMFDALTKQSFDLIVLDLKLEHSSSLSSIAKVRELSSAAKIIMVTGFASIATTVEAIKQGADDYLPKPVTADDILRAYFEGDIALSEEVDNVRLSPKRVEWEHIQRVLQENEGNISRTAEQLNMHRRTLQRKLQKKPH